MCSCDRNKSEHPEPIPATIGPESKEPISQNWKPKANFVTLMQACLLHHYCNKDAQRQSKLTV